MQFVEPKVFAIAQTQINPAGFAAMLEALGVADWQSDGESDTEILLEAAGKMCYMSFDTSLNKNLTKANTRSNFDYLQDGIIKTRHGSVLEHGTVTFCFVDVSRVLTHELVRHRAGAAYSQTSGRYVRSDVLNFFLPTVFKENIELAEVFDKAIASQEDFIRQMEEVSRINNMTSKEDFTLKKKLTSAFRRIIGNGVANNIICTYNHRALRNIIVQRTSVHAEEEIRIVFNKVFDLVSNMFPALYADAHREMIDDHWEITFASDKV